MDEQYKKYQGTLVDEIETIESAFVEERIELIEEDAKELDQLFETRRANEALK